MYSPLHPTFTTVQQAGEVVRITVNSRTLVETTSGYFTIDRPISAIKGSHTTLLRDQFSREWIELDGHHYQILR